MRILIAGCGYVGGRLAAELAAGGDEVWGLKRRTAPLPAGVRPLVADLGDAASLTRLPAGVDAVVYAAGPGGRDEAAYRRVYLDGPANLLAALARAGERPRRFVFVSSTAVYHQDAGEWVDEETPVAPATWNGRILRQAERRVLAAPFPATAVRLGGIYGPGRARLLDRVRAGEATVEGGAAVYANRVHRDDAAGLLAHLLARVAAGEEVAALYLGVDGEPAPRAEVVRWLAARLGAPPPAVVTPPPSSRGAGKRCSNARLRAAGYSFRFPTFREGYGALL